MTESEKLEQAILTSAQIMIENNLGDWKLKLSNKRTTLADCNLAEKTIRFSKHFLKVATKDEFIGVTYHEVAHALLPAWVHHGPDFVKKCIEISPSPKFANVGYSICISKFLTNCPECGTSGIANRLGRNICIPCLNKGNRVRVDYYPNTASVTAW